MGSQADRKTNRQATQTSTQHRIEAEGQTNRHAGRKNANRPEDKQSDTQTGKQRHTY